jgi:hypothetical protein
MDVKIAVDNVFVGWLSRVANLSVKDTLFALYDMSYAARESLMEKNGSWRIRKATFPGTDIKLKVHAARYYDRNQRWRDLRAWEDKCTSETGLNANSYPATNWVRLNPKPSFHDEKYNFVKVTFKVDTDNRETIISQHEIETMMTEEFLLGYSNREECEDVAVLSHAEDVGGVVEDN